ncbi:MAG: glycerol-3-phosphate 1-O-acyltransferase PlsY [Rhizobiaceae bacterium]|nr:glycerol-3-phosphate 1-O-acyltransferase PlsY [Rhizobiaceae bacterium]
MVVVVALIFGYLLGSIPFGLLLTRAAGLGDVRSIGSGNIGATNVLRTGNKGLAAATLLLDMLKGTLAVLVASQFGLEAAMAAGFAAFIGHIFPAWLGFKGGKGVATYLGVLLGFGINPALVFAVVWISMALMFRFSSLAALSAAIIVPISLYYMGMPEISLMFAVMSIIVFWKHRANIQRLAAGIETKIGSKG